MKLNRLQRHTAYVIMLAEAERPKRFKDYGLCELSYDVFEFKTEGSESHWVDNIRLFFPELYKKRTTDDNLSKWFEYSKKGWNSRKKILKQCINETA